MSMRFPAPRPRRHSLVAAACLLASAAAGGGEASPLPDPTDPAAPAPPTPANRTLPEGAGGYLQDVDAPRLPWTRLYRPGGAFVPESELRPGSAQAPAMPLGAGDGSASMHGATMPSGHASMGDASAASDARGVVRAVDPAQGKVTLKHGPIERLEMPGMTMIFRVRDAAVLEGLGKGDEVRFNVEIEGTTFYVTEIHKQAGSQ